MSLPWQMSCAPPSLWLQEKKKDMPILQALFAGGINGTKLVKKIKVFFSAGNLTLNTFLACMFWFPNRPFVYLAIHVVLAVQHHHASEQKPHWDIRQTKEITIILKVYMPFVCLSQCAFCSPA